MSLCGRLEGPDELASEARVIEDHLVRSDGRGGNGGWIGQESLCGISGIAGSEDGDSCPKYWAAASGEALAGKGTGADLEAT